MIKNIAKCSVILVLVLGTFVRDVNGEVSDKCKACICEGSSNCQVDVGCIGDVCGPFKITLGYWKDAGQIGTSFSDCANSLECVSGVIDNYMTKYQKDCNGDGLINCDDYALIHRFGPYGCERQLTAENDFLEKYITCKQSLQIYK